MYTMYILTETSSEKLIAKNGHSEIPFTFISMQVHSNIQNSEVSTGVTQQLQRVSYFENKGTFLCYYNFFIIVMVNGRQAQGH